MAFVDVVGEERRAERGIGRRREDRAIRGAGWPADRERRHPVARTDAAAQSVVMAGLSAQPGPAIKQDAAALYAASILKKTEAELQREAFLHEAELLHQAEQRAWVFERRTGQKPRADHVEDAEFIDIGPDPAR